MPIMHGSQGCTAFAKVFFVRHFREPIPLQTTAMDQVSSVMGADDNIVEAIKTTQGADISGSVGRFQNEYPELAEHSAVVAVNTPDFSGCFETGFALALKAIIETLVPDTAQSAQSRVGLRHKQVNVLAHANLTPGDLEYIIESIESFGLRPMYLYPI